MGRRCNRGALGLACLPRVLGGRCSRRAWYVALFGFILGVAKWILLSLTEDLGLVLSNNLFASWEFLCLSEFPEQSYLDGFLPCIEQQSFQGQVCSCTRLPSFDTAQNTSFSLPGPIGLKYHKPSSAQVAARQQKFAEIEGRHFGLGHLVVPGLSADGEHCHT